MKFKEKKSFTNIPQAEGMNIVQRTKFQTYGNAMVTKKALAFTNIYKAGHNLSPAHQQKCRQPVH